MTTVRIAIGLLGAVLLTLPLRADLSAAKSEPNLEKRARLALDNADDALKAAHAAYGKGEPKETQAALDEVGASVQLAYESLNATGKKPNRSPKHFKNAEIKTRELLRHMDDFRDEMSAEDRDMIDKPRATVQQVHEDLLLGIMGTKSGK